MSEENSDKITFTVTQDGAHRIMELFRERGISEEEIERCFPRVRHMWVEEYDGSTGSKSD